MSLIAQSGQAARAVSGALSKAFSSGVSAGNTIAVAASCYGVVSSFSSGNITDSQGNVYTLQAESHSDNANVGIWTATASSGGPLTVTSNVSGGANDLIIAEISGPTVPTVVLDIETAFANSNTLVIPAISISDSDGAVILTALYNESTASTWTFSPADYTIDQFTANGGGHSLVFAHQFESGAGAYGGQSAIASGISSGIASVTISLGQTPSVDITGSGSASFYFTGLGSGTVTDGPPAPTAPTITCGSPPSGVTGIAYTHTFPASGGTSPFTFSITAGALPDGLSLDASIGTVSGTPSAAGTFSFTVLVTDSGALTDSADCSITIGDIALSCGNPPTGSTGVPYFHTFPESGGTPPFTFAILSGSLPDGLTLDPTSGLVSGVPTTAGTFSFTLQVTGS